MRELVSASGRGEAVMARRLRLYRHGKPVTGQKLEHLVQAARGPSDRGRPEIDVVRIEDEPAAGERRPDQGDQARAVEAGVDPAEVRALVDGTAGLEALRRKLVLEQAAIAERMADLPQLPAAGGGDEIAPSLSSAPSPPSEVFGMSLRLFGTVFSTGSATDILATAASIPGAGPRLVVTANIDHVVILSDNAAFRKAYEGAAVRTLDGLPLVWLARALGSRRAVRVTGHDLLAAAFAMRPASDMRVYLVASTDRVVDNIRRRFVANGLAADAVAAAVPPFGFEDDAAFGRHLAERIRAHGTTLLVMGVGAPKSEIWVDGMGEALGSPVVLSVGEALNVAAGLVPRAPVLMQRMGMEWLFRFAHAPRRLFKRYFVRSWRFAGIASRELSHVSWRPAARPPVRAVPVDDRRTGP